MMMVEVVGPVVPASNVAGIMFDICALARGDARQESLTVPHREKLRKRRWRCFRHGFDVFETPEVRELFSENDFPRRKRMSPEGRRHQIIKVAAEVIAAKGFWGMSLQDIADEIGITESALYHYINTKNDLLGLIIEELYDSSSADAYIYGNAKYVDVDGHELFFFPRFCLDNILYNTQRPELVKLFSILNAEALNPEHPAHHYFIMRQQKFWMQISSMNWMLPDLYRLDTNRFHHLWTLAMSAMDGLQLRWLADASADMTEEWFAFSEVLFPQDLWEGFADPSEYEPASAVCLQPHGLQQSSGMRS